MITAMTERTADRVPREEPDVGLTDCTASVETDSKLEQEDGQQDGERDGQQDGERDGHQDGERDGQQDGERDGHQDGERDGQQDGERDGQQDGERDGQQDGERDGHQDGERDGQQDGERDGQQDGERDGHQDGERDGHQDGERDGHQDGEGDGKQDRERDGQQDRERDGQQDRETVCSPAAESCSSEPKWVVGAECRAVWVEDGQLYPAKVVSLDGERCRVRFHGYGNEEEVELSALQSPDAAVQPQRHVSQNWRAGSRCRAMYSGDGLVYPAVVLWVKGQRCRVRFDDYNNEEEQEVGNLLSPDELHGPSKATTAKVSSWTDWKRRREENQEGGGAERRAAWREEQHCSSSEVKEQLSNRSKVEKETGAEIPTNHSFSFFPPFPPPPQSGSPDSVTFIPPPPPPLGGSATSSMLMLWYTCGFHTGSYMAQQVFKSSSKH